MIYSEFKSELCNCLLDKWNGDKLYNNLGKSTISSNEECIIILSKVDGFPIFGIYNLNYLFNCMLRTKTIDDIVEDILKDWKVIVKDTNAVKELLIKSMSHYDDAKSYITALTEQHHRTQLLASNIIYKLIDDFISYPVVQLNDSLFLGLTDTMCRSWKVSKEEVISKALKQPMWKTTSNITKVG